MSRPATTGILPGALRAWRRLYGEDPRHLLAVLGCFLLAGYAVSFVVPGPLARSLGLWFAGCVIGHDLVAYPLYALADRALLALRRVRPPSRRVAPVPVLNHVRVPALGSAVLGLIYLPTLSLRGDPAFTFASGHPMTGQLGHWLLITGGLFLGSAVIWCLRLVSTK